MDMTPNLNLPIPNADAVPPTKISEEFPRLADALIMLDAIIFALQGAVAGKAAADHTQAISTIIGLAEALAAKMPANATFSLDSLTDVQGATDALVNYVLVKKASGQWEPSSALAALGIHNHSISEIVGLTEQLVDILDDLSLKANADAVAAALGLKANSADVYTKAADPISMSKAPSQMEWVSNTQIRVKAASFRDQADARNIMVAADTVYTLPSPAASTHYHVLVGYDAVGAVAVTTQNSNTHSLPSGWQAYRRIGSIFTNASSQIRKFLQTGDEFLFDDSIYELDASAFSTSAALTTINVPPNCLARLRGTLNTGAGTSSDTDMIIITCPDQVARAPTFKDFSFGVLGSSGGYACNDFEVFTDAARRIRRQSSNGVKPARLITLGYNDRRGRDF